MAKIFSIMVLATMLALIAPAIAQLPSEAVAGNREDIPAINRSIINQFDPTNVWNNPYALDKIVVELSRKKETVLCHTMYLATIRKKQF